MATITVYAIAWGGKFIGTGQQGIAKLTVTDPSDIKIVDNQPITQGTVSGDGSGDLTAIMEKKCVVWGTPVDKSEAYYYSFDYEPGKPVQLTFTVDVYHYGELKATASVQQWVWPGLTLSGDTSVVVVLPGLLTNIVAPQNPLVLFYQKRNIISVNVYMMCGCMTDNQYWPGENFDVQAVITDMGGRLIDTVTLTGNGPATFSGFWTPQTLEKLQVQAFVVEKINGNTACSSMVPAIVNPL